jgi:hypothetical protein
MRYVTTFFAVASFILWLAMTVFWLRSYFRYDRIETNTSVDERGHSTSLTINSSTGYLDVGLTRWITQQIEPGSPEAKWHYVHDQTIVDSRLYHLWVDGEGPLGMLHFSNAYDDQHRSNEWSYRQWIVGLPFWCPWILSLCVWLIPVCGRVRAWRRKGGGACRSCGYDLRASKDRCPECGTPILSKVKASP